MNEYVTYVFMHFPCMYMFAGRNTVFISLASFPYFVLATFLLFTWFSLVFNVCVSLLL